MHYCLNGALHQDRCDCPCADCGASREEERVATDPAESGAVEGSERGSTPHLLTTCDTWRCVQPPTDGSDLCAMHLAEAVWSLHLDGDHGLCGEFDLDCRWIASDRTESGTP